MFPEEKYVVNVPPPYGLYSDYLSSSISTISKMLYGDANFVPIAVPCFCLSVYFSNENKLFFNTTYYLLLYLYYIYICVCVCVCLCDMCVLCVCLYVFVLSKCRIEHIVRNIVLHCRSACHPH